MEIFRCNRSQMFFNPFSANFTKWSNTLKQFVVNLPTNCLSMFDHFLRLALKGLKLVFLEISKIHRKTPMLDSY